MLMQAYSAFVVQNYMQSHAVVLYADPNISLSFHWLSVRKSVRFNWKVDFLKGSNTSSACSLGI